MENVAQILPYFAAKYKEDLTNPKIPWAALKLVGESIEEPSRWFRAAILPEKYANAVRDGTLVPDETQRLDELVPELQPLPLHECMRKIASQHRKEFSGEVPCGDIIYMCLQLPLHKRNGEEGAPQCTECIENLDTWSADSYKSHLTSTVFTGYEAFIIHVLHHVEESWPDDKGQSYEDAMRWMYELGVVGAAFPLLMQHADQCASECEKRRMQLSTCKPPILELMDCYDNTLCLAVPVCMDDEDGQKRRVYSVSVLFTPFADGSIVEIQWDCDTKGKPSSSVKCACRFCREVSTQTEDVCKGEIASQTEKQADEDQRQRDSNKRSRQEDCCFSFYIS